MQLEMNLGYQGSEYLYRTSEGIKSKQNFDGLSHYPVKVKFTLGAINEVARRFSEDDQVSSVDIFAKTLSGSRVEIFTIGSNFFGHMTSVRGGNTNHLSDYVRTVFSPLHNEHQVLQGMFEMYPDNPMFSERTYTNMIRKHWNLNPQDPVVSFDAEYYLSDNSGPVEHFSVEVSQTRKKESLLLRIDYLLGKFILKLEHTNEQLRRLGEAEDVKKVKMEILPIPVSPPQIAVTEPFVPAAAAGKKFKPNVEEKKVIMEKMIPQPPIEKVVDDDILNDDVPAAFICLITTEIMTDPVVDKEGNSYERKAIEGWLEKNSTSPVTRNPLSISDLAPNRALKSLIAMYNKGKK